jgi:hypothetical protein
MNKPILRKNFEDNHHIVPKARMKDGYNVHTTENIIRIQRRVHENIHHLFWVKVPHEKIEYILQMDKKVINRKYVKQIMDILQQEDFYINNIKWNQ